MMHYKKTAVIICTAAILLSTFELLPQAVESIPTAITANAVETAKETVTLSISDGNIVITSTGYSVGGSAETAYTGDYIITGETTVNSVKVTGSHNIIIRDINIDNSDHGYNYQYQSLDFRNAGECVLTLEGKNVIKANGDTPAIYVPENTMFTINGSGTLDAYGGDAWPAIGRSGGGNIVINDVTINAHGGNNAAGIGGSFGFTVGKVTINNAVVNAWGGGECNGIDSGATERGGEFTIINSTVNSYRSGGTPAALDSNGATVTYVSSIVNDEAKNLSDNDNIYIDADGIKKVAQNCTPITSETIELSSGWYVVKDNFTTNSRLQVNGDVHIILADGCNWTVNYGIEVSESGNLTIYAQSTDESTMGTLVANSKRYDAGIGSGYNGTNGAITINGGNVTAIGGKRGAGIGSGWYGTSGAIIINGGNVTATGSKYGSGIGSGWGGKIESITIKGGTVEATGGGEASGIGGGLDTPEFNLTSKCGAIIIENANVKATGEVYPGIGGGNSGTVDSITIKHSTVESYQSNNYDNLHKKQTSGVPSDKITIVCSNINETEIHQKYEYTFNWVTDYNHCTASRRCIVDESKCKYTETVDCKITSEQVGYDIVYTATATFADKTEEIDTKTQSLSPQYTVTIPATVNADKELEVSADVEYILDSEQVSVTLNESTDFKLELENYADVTLPYVLLNVDNNRQISQNDKFLTAVKGDKKTVKLKVKPSQPKYAGKYKDTLTFDVKLENKN